MREKAFISTRLRLCKLSRRLHRDAIFILNCQLSEIIKKSSRLFISTTERN